MTTKYDSTPATPDEIRREVRRLSSSPEFQPWHTSVFCEMAATDIEETQPQASLYRIAAAFRRLQHTCEEAPTIAHMLFAISQVDADDILEAVKLRKLYRWRLRRLRALPRSGRGAT